LSVMLLLLLLLLPPLQLLLLLLLLLPQQPPLGPGTRLVRRWTSASSTLGRLARRCLRARASQR